MQKSWSHFFNGRREELLSQPLAFTDGSCTGPPRNEASAILARPRDCVDHGHLHHASKSYMGRCMRMAQRLVKSGKMWKCGKLGGSLGRRVHGIDGLVLSQSESSCVTASPVDGNLRKSSQRHCTFDQPSTTCLRLKSPPSRLHLLIYPPHR